MDDCLLGLWRQAWEKYVKQLDVSKWADQKWREPFELLGAALIYSYNALKHMPEQVLHSNVREAIKDRRQVWKSLSGKEPDFCQNTDERFEGLYATMHLASISFRLTTALFLVCSQTGALSEFFNHGRVDWSRAEDKLKNYLENAKNLECCRRGGCPDEKTALTMIIAHRDEFGHGEKGEGKRWWFQNREGYFNEFFICRILQAQLTLTGLGLDELSRTKRDPSS